MEWNRVYEIFWNHVIINQLHLDPVNHICTPDARDCSHYHVKGTDYYICEQSGLVHECTLDACTCKIITEETQVCPISGIQYPLDMDDTPDVQHQFDGTHQLHFRKSKIVENMTTEQIKNAPVMEYKEYEESTRNSKKFRLTSSQLRLQNKLLGGKIIDKKKDKTKIKERIHKITERLLMGAKRQDANRKRIEQFDRRVIYKFRRYILTQMKNKKPIFFDFLYNVFLHEEQWCATLILPQCTPEELQKRCRVYARKAYQWWKKIKPLVNPREKYEPLFHTVAYLYTSAKGLRDDLQGPLVVLPKDPFLAAVLPPLACLTELEITPRSYTKHQSILQRIMGQLYSDEHNAKLQRNSTTTC